MELWEGAVLVVGGLLLVRHMVNKNAAVQSTGITAASTGVSNQSNLTNITSSSGGYPTLMGEPLEPPQAPIVASPVTHNNFRRPIGQPRPVMGLPPKSIVGGLVVNPPSPVTGRVGARLGGGRPVPFAPINARQIPGAQFNPKIPPMQMHL